MLGRLFFGWGAQAQQAAQEAAATAHEQQRALWRTSSSANYSALDRAWADWEARRVDLLTKIELAKVERDWARDKLFIASKKLHTAESELYAHMEKKP